MNRDNFERASEIMREIEELEKEIDVLYSANEEKKGNVVIIGKGIPHVPLLDRNNNSVSIGRLVEDAITEKIRQKEDLENELKQL